MNITTETVAVAVRFELDALTGLPVARTAEWAVVGHQGVAVVYGAPFDGIDGDNGMVIGRFGWDGEPTFEVLVTTWLASYKPRHAATEAPQGWASVTA